MRLLAELTIPGTPVAQGRPRARRHGDGVQVYDPPKTAKWKRGACIVMRAAAPKPLPLCEPDTPLGVEVVVIHARPKSMSLLRQPGPVWKTSKPDVDNILKALLDAGGMAGLWHDDAQIVRLDARKVWRGSDQKPGITLRVYALDDLPQ